MSVTLASDMKIYDPRIQGGFRERLDYVIDVFNTNSRGAVNLSRKSKPGNYDYEAFFKRVSGLVNRRDTTSTSAATPTKSTQGEMIGVKMSRRVGPHDVTRDALVKAGLTFGDDGAAFALGGFAAEAASAERVDTGFLALRAALLNQSTVKTTVWDATTPVYMSNAQLINGIAKRGDRAGDVVCWVMHSQAYFKLVYGQVVTDKVTGIADITMNGGSPASLNKPVLVTDSPSLVVDNGSGTYPLKYYTLGLAAGALEIEDTEEEFIASQVVLGGENLIYRLQGEYAYNMKLMGMQWDVTNGGANPNGSAIGTGSNWDMVVDSYKNLGGVIIETN